MLAALAELEARVSEAERKSAQSRATLNATQEEKSEATKVFRQERAILEGKSAKSEKAFWMLAFDRRLYFYGGKRG